MFGDILLRITVEKILIRGGEIYRNGDSADSFFGTRAPRVSLLSLVIPRTCKLIRSGEPPLYKYEAINMDSIRLSDRSFRGFAPKIQ